MSGTNLPATDVPTIVSGGAPAPIEPASSLPAADTPTLTTSASTPEPVITETPAEPAATPAETPAATPATEEKPAEGAQPTGEAKPAEGGEAKPALHTDKPTLLEGDGTEKKPDAASEKPADKPAEAADAFKYEAFKLPDGVQADEPTISKFTEIIGPHKVDQETAQKLVDLYSDRMTAFAQELSAEQHRIFAETRTGWVNKIMADPILGGAGHQTALQAAARMRDLLVPEEHRAEFADFMRVTGAGDHPALMRLLHTAARLFDEPAPPPIPARPVPDRGGNGTQSRAATIYDHPTSRRAAGR